MRIGILGAGSMGGLFGGFMAAAGDEVVLYDVDEALVAAINDDGLLVERPDGEDLATAPVATTDPGEGGDLDVTFVFVKSQHTAKALETFDPVLRRSASVVTVQNGLTNYYTLRDHCGEAKAYGGYTTNGANTVEPGHVTLLGVGDTVVGGQDPEVAAEIADHLSAVGLPGTAVEDPVPHIWDKQFINVAIKPVAALTDLRHGGMYASENARAIMRNLIDEALAVAEAMDVEPVWDDPFESLLGIIGREDKKHKKSSIVEDMLAERKTEIEHINGAIVTFGREHGVATPYNWLATKLVQAKEESYLGTDR